MSDSDIKEPHQKRQCVDYIEEDKAKVINCGKLETISIWNSIDSL